MIDKYVRIIKNHVLNYPGWRSNRKIVVIESDDWGSIRCPDKPFLNRFKKIIGDRPSNPYLKVDSLASEEDLSHLFDLLNTYKDHKGRPPVITFNVILANPNFEKINDSEFQEYFYEPFQNTLSRYDSHVNSFSIWKKAMECGLMHPQIHGREHVNVLKWLELLRSGHKELREVFQLGTWALPHDSSVSNTKLQSALDYEINYPREFHYKYIADAQAMFEKAFGFRSISFIPTNFTTDPGLASNLHLWDIKAMQGMKYLVYPKGRNVGQPRHFERRIAGFDKKFKLYNLVRNANFEPSQKAPNHDNIGFCMSAINNAFFHNKPAIINAHRLNFVGYIDPGNRDRNLRLLHKLLHRIICRWPDVEFMSSEELVKEMMGYNNSKNADKNE